MNSFRRTRYRYIYIVNDKFIIVRLWKDPIYSEIKETIKTLNENIYYLVIYEEPTSHLLFWHQKETDQIYSEGGYSQDKQEHLYLFTWNGLAEEQSTANSNKFILWTIQEELMIRNNP